MRDDGKNLFRTLRDEEFLLLAAIASLADQLPDDLASYAPILGSMRKKFFRLTGKHTPSRRRNPKGFNESRQPHASKRYGT